MNEIPGPIVVRRDAEKAASAPAHPLDRPAAAALIAAGLIFLAGSLADYFLLWVINRQDGSQWEFAAVTTTVEGMSRIVLGIALIYGGLYVRGRPVVWLRRILGVTLLLTALASVALGGLMALDFLALRNNVRPEAVATFRATAAKTLFLCALYFVVSVPAGVASLRARRSPA